MFSCRILRGFCQISQSEFRSFPKSFTRHSKTTKSSLGGSAVQTVESTSSILGYKSLLKPFLFTISFSGCCFAAASIWQYEEMRKLAQRLSNRQLSASLFDHFSYQQKRSQFRRQMHAWWHMHSEGEKIALIIASINMGVFLLWRIPSMTVFMKKYFTCGPSMNGSCLPMFLSTFSHYSFFHLAANMLVLYSFSSRAVSYFGKEQFVAVYCSAGVISSFTSIVFKTATRRILPSLGASGALMAVLSSMCVQYPHTELAIIFLPFFTFSAGSAIKAVMAFDVVGLFTKWHLFDHAAHLGGAIYGILYLKYGHDYIWSKREHLFQLYHHIREKKK